MHCMGGIEKCHVTNVTEDMGNQSLIFLRKEIEL